MCQSCRIVGFKGATSSIFPWCSQGDQGVNGANLYLFFFKFSISKRKIDSSTLLNGKLFLFPVSALGFVSRLLLSSVMALFLCLQGYFFYDNGIKSKMECWRVSGVK